MKKTRAISLLLSLSLVCAMLVPGASAYAENGGSDNGMVIHKTATANSDGSYTIELEAYATGESITTTVTEDIPTDIVLVLDQSGSMNENMSSAQGFAAYKNQSNSSLYPARFNNDSYYADKNLYYPVGDGYAEVSVERQQRYTEYSNSTTNSTYYSDRNNLYIKDENGGYQQVTVNRSGRYPDHSYTYSVAKQTICSSDGANGIPDFGSYGPLYRPVNRDYVYTYSYKLDGQDRVVIETSEGKNTVPSKTYYYKGTVNTTKLQALQSAVTNFANAVAEKAKGADDQYGTDDDVNHRIAVVKFTNSATDLTNGLVEMKNANGLTTVQNVVNSLTAGGDTYPETGLNTANSIFEANPVQAGEKRNRVIILFTDGYPAESGTDNINYTLCDNAIVNAKISKETYGATVYTVGIFSGANPNSDIDSNFEYGNRRDNAKQLVAANRYMHYTSSNFKDAQSMQNGGTKSGNGYYLSAADADTLNNIFQQISGQIETGGSETTLGSETVVKDIISPYFTLPAETTASGIQIDTYDCTGKNGDTYTWSSTSGGTGGASATVNGDQVSVTGFNFSENWCGTETYTQGNTTVRGKKLVISFTVDPKREFLGGNDVITNASAGIYENGSAQTPVMTFEQPKVNVPIQDVTVTAGDKNVYLLGDVTAEQLKDGAEVKVGSSTLDLSKANDAYRPYGLEKWQTEYVNITVAVKDKDGNAVPADGLKALTDDTTYTIEVTVAPKNTNPTSAQGETATEKSGTNTPAAKINVFKPELTFKDSEVYYGADVPADFSGNLTNTEWKHGDTLDTAQGVTMTGTAPTLSLTYTPEEGKIKDGKINTKQDIGVDVTVKLSGTDVTDNTTFLHTNCTGQTCTLPEGKEFLLHVKTCTLTINKTGGAAGESYVFDVLKDGTKYSEVTIEGNGTETLYELPVGSYTITENTGWSWRYNANNGTAASLTADSPNGSITCTNTKTQNYWLNGFSQVIRNIFGTANN